jgi:hypothetical protein
VFDVSSMQPEDVQRAVDSARKYVDEQMTPADLIAVATVGIGPDVLTDFTDDRTRVASALAVLAYTDGTATEMPDALTAATDEGRGGRKRRPTRRRRDSTCSTTTSGCGR